MKFRAHPQYFDPRPEQPWQEARRMARIAAHDEAGAAKPVAIEASRAKEAAGRTAELLLEHRLFRSLHTGDVIKDEWLVPHYPPYWHYDIYQGLLVLSRLGRLGDPRAAEALDLLVRRQRSDGRWYAGNYWWKAPGNPRSAEAVDWGRSAPSEMLTLNALRILRSSGRLH